MKSSSLLVLILCLIAACGRTPSTEPVAAPVAMRESMALCLADVQGDSPIDTALRKAQSLAFKAPARSEVWTLAAQQWVRKARFAGDPGFYLNVDGCIDETLAIVANDASALALRGLVLMNMHRFAAARALSERILASDPENTLALGTLSDAWLELGDYAQAILAAQRQMSALPGMAAYSRGAYLSWLHGDSARAKLLIRDALQGRSRSDPEPAAWAFVEAARLYWHEGDYAGADALLAEALTWVHDYPSALLLRARVALANDDAKLAIDYLTRACRQQPTTECAWLLSDAYAAAASSADSQHWFEQALRLGTQSDPLTLGLMLAVHGRDLPRALSLLEEERRVRGGIYVDDAYAWALFRAGRLDDAAHYITKAMRLRTPDARLLYHAGAIYIARGENHQGEKLIRQALALNPGFDRNEARAARALLSEHDVASR